MHPKLSIITINKNNLEGLRLTSKSILEQKIEKLEWLVIDGGSNDGSIEFIRSKSKYIDVWVSELDKGIYHAMNKGAQLSRGDYLIYMNSGDQFVPNILNDELLNNLTGDIIYGDNMIVGPSGNLILVNQPTNLTFQNLYAGCICHQSCFIKRELQLEIPYDENLRLASCRKFFWDSIVFGNCTVKHLNIPISIFDVNGVSSTQKSKLLDEVDSILPDYLPPKIITDMQRLKEYDRFTRNSELFLLIQSIHEYRKKKKLFEKIALFFAKFIFPKSVILSFKGR
jgi:glycosyltransferase involved in cell wall biosynthesis